MAAKPVAKNDSALDQGPLRPEEEVINDEVLESLTPQARDDILSAAAAADAWLDQGMRMTWTRWLELGNGIALVQQECMRAAGGRNDPQGARSSRRAAKLTHGCLNAIRMREKTRSGAVAD